MADTQTSRPQEVAAKSPAATTEAALSQTGTKTAAAPAKTETAKPAAKTAAAKKAPAKVSAAKAPAAKTPAAAKRAATKSKAAANPVAAKSKAATKAKTAKPAARKATATKSARKAPAAKVARKPVRQATKSDKESIFMTKTIEAQAIQTPEFVRAFAEKSVEQARETYARVKGTAEEATDAIEETFETARDNLLDVQHKSLDIAKANADATFDFARNLLGVTSVSDAVQLQTSFARDRFEALMDYSKVLQSSATKMAEETSKPVKAVVTKAVDSVRAA